MDLKKTAIGQQVNKTQIIRVGTRKSQLALIQTNLVVDRLKEFYANNPGRFYELYGGKDRLDLEPKFQVVAMTTTGDTIQDKPLPSIGTKSLFTRELEIALLDGRVDFVVHSLKDLPTTIPDGCVIGAVMKRDDPNDVIVLKKSLIPQSNPIELFLRNTVDVGANKPKIGTSSHRRIAMIRRINRNMECVDIRGNLNTRLRKLDDEEGSYTAIVLAKAGLDRMNWSDRVSALLSPEVHRAFEDWCYAVGQGAIAVECRSNDRATLDILTPIVDLQTTYETVAERSLMKKLEGGCSVPLGVRSTWAKNQSILLLSGIVLALDGNTVVKATDQVVVTDERATSGAEFSPIDCFTTGVKVSKTFKDSGVIEEKLLVCAKLGVNVANKMIDQGCLELIKQE